MAESLSEAVKSTGVKILWKSGGEFLIDINTDSVEVAKEVCKTAVKLSALYVGYQLLRPVIDAAVKKALGGERDDQEVKDIKPGSLHVVLHCFTDERFLAVLTDYLSGKIKERLEEEFSHVGIKVKGLKVEIQNTAEVNKIKEAIYKRNLCKDVQNIAMDNGESYVKKNVDEMESQMSAAVRRKQEEIVHNLDQTKIVSMAVTQENVQEGYDVTRFVGEVKEDLLCLICNDVPKDPRLCKNKDHIFCLAHISRHLQDSQTCPYCRDPLTSEALRRPTGFLKNYLDDLKIKCDHHDRGCPEVVRLECLPRHVDQCEFAPVMCGNEACGMVVNKSEKENHEKYLCKFRIAMCHDCKEIKASQGEMKANQDKWKDEMKVELTEVKNKMTAIERKQDRMQQSVDEMKQQIEGLMEVFIRRVEENNVDNNVHNNVDNNGAQATDPQVSGNNYHIIILGGWYGLELDQASNSVEGINIAEGKSTELPRMNKLRAESASCVYNGDVMVTGGFDGQDGIDSIEILKMSQQPLRWTTFERELPAPLFGHVAMIFQNKLYLIGGCKGYEGKTSDIIYELDLAPPFAARLPARMPQARRNHGAEIVNGKLFILGGTTDIRSEDAIDSVVVYDFITKEFKTCPSLPKAVCNMSTVTWGNKIIIIGGADKNDQILNDVIMYDTETGQTEQLPSLWQKRWGSSVAIIEDVIVVLGGLNEYRECLNSVESFKMGSDGWEELPRMKEKRHHATAVVIPRI